MRFLIFLIFMSTLLSSCSDRAVIVFKDRSSNSPSDNNDSNDSDDDDGDDDNTIACVSTATPFGAGAGTELSPYEICSVSHLNEVRNHLDSHFILKDDIDLQGQSFDPIPNNLDALDWTANGGEAPDSAIGFSGVFDGNNFTVKNWSFSSNTINMLGLFAYIQSGAIVKNLTLESFTLNLSTTNSYNLLSMLAAYNEGTIEDVTVLANAPLTVSETDNYHASAYQMGGGIGIVAALNNGIIRNTSVTVSASISASDDDGTVAGISAILFGSIEDSTLTIEATGELVTQNAQNFYAGSAGLVGAGFAGSSLTNSSIIIHGAIETQNSLNPGPSFAWTAGGVGALANDMLIEGVSVTLKSGGSISAGTFGMIAAQTAILATGSTGSIENAEVTTEIGSTMSVGANGWLGGISCYGGGSSINNSTIYLGGTITSPTNDWGWLGQWDAGIIGETGNLGFDTSGGGQVALGNGVGVTQKFGQ